MRGQPRHNTRPHTQLPPSFLAIFCGMLSMGDCTGAEIKCLYCRRKVPIESGEPSLDKHPGWWMPGYS